jgi:hypothetical protein|tara:strand:- start:429 stop:803 length:375 start_codon:yes stop_codon:yes gene_type:complete
MATDNLILRVAKNKIYSETPLITTNDNGNIVFTYGKLKVTCSPFDMSASSTHKMIADIQGTEILVQDSCSNAQEVLVQTQGKKVIDEVRVNDKLSLRQLVDKFTGFFGFFNNRDFTKVRLDVQS